jgi:hypothetical protein
MDSPGRGAHRRADVMPVLLVQIGNDLFRRIDQRMILRRQFSVMHAFKRSDTLNEESWANGAKATLVNGFRGALATPGPVLDQRAKPNPGMSRSSLP